MVLYTAKHSRGKLSLAWPDRFFPFFFVAFFRFSLWWRHHKEKRKKAVWPHETRGNFCGFHGFSLSYKCFPTNYDLVDWQCKSTHMLPRKFFRKWQFCTLTAKVFPLESFAVYSILIKTPSFEGAQSLTTLASLS